MSFFTTFIRGVVEKRVLVIFASIVVPIDLFFFHNDMRDIAIPRREVTESAVGTDDEIAERERE